MCVCVVSEAGRTRVDPVIVENAMASAWIEGAPGAIAAVQGGQAVVQTAGLPVERAGTGTMAHAKAVAMTRPTARRATP